MPERIAKRTRLEESDHEVREGYLRLFEARLDADDVPNVDLFNSFPKHRGRVRTKYGSSQCLYCEEEVGVFLLELTRTDRQRLHMHGDPRNGDSGSTERIIVVSGTVSVTTADGTRHVLKRTSDHKTDLFIPAGMPHSTYWTGGSVVIVCCQKVE